IYNDKRGCAYCHVMEDDANHKVAPVLMRARFLPNASFNHARHAATDCADCHDSRHSETSADVMVPGIESCTGCHGGARASFRAQSQCVTCHAFHRPDFGPMRHTAVATP
ncbi:MAG: cytochrome c3 family protein, partial [Alphaproteobacteria bacterium]|nr:cytochrome c3 family protein [Alphaproteobacteria bacterium]